MRTFLVPQKYNELATARSRCEKQFVFDCLRFRVITQKLIWYSSRSSTPIAKTKHKMRDMGQKNQSIICLLTLTSRVKVVNIIIIILPAGVAQKTRQMYFIPKTIVFDQGYVTRLSLSRRPQLKHFYLAMTKTATSKDRHISTNQFKSIANLRSWLILILTYLTGSPKIYPRYYNLSPMKTGQSISKRRYA